MEEFIFEKLEVWQKSKVLVSKIYKLIESLPSFEKFSLCDQIRRAAISIVSNIAEGSGRSSVKEKVHFIEIAYGSLMEVYCQLLIAPELGYIPESEVKGLREEFIEIAKMLSGWRQNLKNKL